MKLGKPLSVGGLIVFGTTTSLFAKIVYEIQSVGKDGTEKYFQKPWAMTTLMFIGMSFCLPLAYWQERSKRKNTPEVEAPLLSHAEAPKRNEVKEVIMLTIPTFFDLAATVLMNVGLLYVTASVYQMMRGAEMLFAAIFSVLFLNRRLNKYHLMGIACCVVGISMVGMASLFSGEGSAVKEISQEQMLLGMGLIITSQAVQAAQLTFEDYFMADMDIPAMKIVGYEGVFGAIATLGIMAPIAYVLPGNEGEGIHEDAFDTLMMIKNSHTLQVILLVDMLALLMYNIAGMMVTGHLGAVFRTVLETFRTLFVWLVDLGLFYGGLGLGESWSMWSWLQAGGFVVLVTGTLVYRRGDDEGTRQQMVEALAVQAASEPVPEQGGYSPVGPHPPASSVPVQIPTPSMPMDMRKPMSLRNSFKVHHAITSGSYGRSIGRSPKLSGAHVQNGSTHGMSEDEQ